MEVTKDSKIPDLLDANHAIAGLLVRLGLPCVVCGEPYWGTLGELARNKTASELEEVIAEIKKIIK